MKKIGVLFGMENTFPSALVDKINSLEIEGIHAEFVRLGGITMADPSGYAVIVDRISHNMPFYRSYLKNAFLTGTYVVNNPFWWSADDKFFNYSLASKLGVVVPRTILLPHKNYPPHIEDRSVRNLEYPLDWEAIFDYVKFPAFLKPHDGGGWCDVFPVHNREEFFAAYDQTRDLCMTLQAAVNYTEYFRCYVVGQKQVHIMPYNPRRPHLERYNLEVTEPDPHVYDKKLLKRIEKDALTLCRALGYDLNTVEFGVVDGIPYAIDFMNPAPDADLNSVGGVHFQWIVNAVANLVIQKAQTPTQPELRWASFLGAPTLKPNPTNEIRRSPSAPKTSAKKPITKRRSKRTA